MAKQAMTQIGRLALREEGDFWNAYYAMPHSMEHAILLGSIRIRFVASDESKSRFMGIMRDAVADLIEEATGIRPVWPEPPRPAPESERAGHS